MIFFLSSKLCDIQVDHAVHNFREKDVLWGWAKAWVDQKTWSILAASRRSISNEAQVRYCYALPLASVHFWNYEWTFWAATLDIRCNLSRLLQENPNNPKFPALKSLTLALAHAHTMMYASVCFPGIRLLILSTSFCGCLKVVFDSS